MTRTSFAMTNLNTNLKRAVAIKVLPDAVAFDSERLARFQREAEVLASLNHPKIAQVYGLENVDGGKALVMELVEGPTLADRISQGPIPLDDALPIARQIAKAPRRDRPRVRRIVNEHPSPAVGQCQQLIAHPIDI
jgi:serine/threonine protein kinase